MKKLAIAVCVFLVLTLSPASVRAEDDSGNGTDTTEQTDTVRQEVQNQIQGLDLSDWERVLGGVPEQARGILGDDALASIIGQFAEGGARVDPVNLIELVFRLLLGEVGGRIGLLVSLVALAVISGLLTNLRSSFASEGVGEIAHYVVYLLMATVLVHLLWQCVGTARDAINAMVDLMQALFPILITVLTAMGNAAAAGVFQPAMAMLTGAVSSFIRDVIMPLVLMSGLIGIVSRMSERFPVKRMGKVLATGVKWATGIIFTVFVGIMTLQGMNAAALDGITIRTAKFTIDKAIPVVGGYMSDTVDTLLGCSLIVKNAAGVTGLVSIVAVLLTPLIRLLAVALSLKVAAALVEPVSDKRLSECMDSVSSTVTMLFVAVLSVGAMFFIAVSLMLGAGNVSVMMR
ncbi:MAG: stage III sporulation protein AE [Christensenellales bacterium]|jgi:stage III sporulation protein AE